MKKGKIGVLVIVLSVVLCGCGAAGQQTVKAELSAALENAEVMSMEPVGMGFLAVGAQGLMAEIHMDGTAEVLDSGTTETLRDISFENGSICAAGDNGTVLYGKEAQELKKENTGENADLYVCAMFQDRLYAAGEQGMVLVKEEGQDWERLDLSLTGTVVGMEAEKGTCMLLTDRGEIAYSSDGSHWSLMDYNDYYGKEVTLKGLCYGNSMFWAFGEGKQKEPVVLFSNEGDIWSERDVNYLEGEEVDLSGYKIRSMASDGQQLYAWCDGGILLTLPECNQCNKESRMEHIKGGVLAYYGGKLMMVQSPKQKEILDTELAKQYLVSAKTAYENQKAGAVIVDVRSLEEYEENHIAGSVLMEIGDITETLPELYPDISQELIFYCSKGVRSQDAVEQARKLGYINVFSLGSMDKWDYGYEKGGNEE